MCQLKMENSQNTYPNVHFRKVSPEHLYPQAACLGTGIYRQTRGVSTGKKVAQNLDFNMPPLGTDAEAARGA
jgi:hypothetical protein